MEKAKSLLVNEEKRREIVQKLEREIHGVDHILSAKRIMGRVLSKYDDEMIRLQREYKELTGNYFPTMYNQTRGEKK